MFTFAQGYNLLFVAVMVIPFVLVSSRTTYRLHQAIGIGSFVEMTIPSQILIRNLFVIYVALSTMIMMALPKMFLIAKEKESGLTSLQDDIKRQKMLAEEQKEKVCAKHSCESV